MQNHLTSDLLYLLVLQTQYGNIEHDVLILQLAEARGFQSCSRFVPTISLYFAAQNIGQR